MYVDHHFFLLKALHRKSNQMFLTLSLFLHEVFILELFLQHLEAMIWCIRHEFLEKICSRHASFATWSADVIERKTCAEKRQWPEVSGKTSDYNEASQGILFIEQALQNLGNQQSYIDYEEEGEITCLQNEQSSSMFRSTIDQSHVNSYPFKNLREAVDILFLHGGSDMVIAKQATVSFFCYHIAHFYIYKVTCIHLKHVSLFLLDIL
jgi:hypothetical protein